MRLRLSPLPLAQAGRPRQPHRPISEISNRFNLRPQAPLVGPLQPASAIAQAGGVVSLSNPIIAGQSFSVVSGSGFGPLTVANGSMGAGYGGINGISITYQESVSFTQIGGAFVLDLLSNDALGKGFDSALFTISLNSVVFVSQSFTDLASAEAFFSNNLIGVPLLAGLNSVQIAFSETMSSAGGFSFDYAVASRRQPCSRPHRRCWTAGPDLGERWSSRLVATAAENLGRACWLQGTAKNLTTTYMTSSICPARFRTLSSTRWASIREAVAATKSYERRKFALVWEIIRGIPD